MKNAPASKKIVFEIRLSSNSKWVKTIKESPVVASMIE